MRTIYKNKRALHDYSLEDRLEVGIALEGWEVKSIKSGHVDMRGAYVYHNGQGELVLRKAKVPGWRTGQPKSLEEQLRDRRLLARKREALKLGGMAKRPGYTLVPFELIVNDRGIVKLLIALVKGKRKYEKKWVAKERDVKRQMLMDMKGA